jgi:hypothetical protein
LHEHEQHNKSRPRDVGDDHEISPAHSVRDRTSNRAKDHRGKRKSQYHKANGSIRLCHVVIVDSLSNAQQEREIDHAVCGLGDSLSDPEAQKREVAEDCPERSMLSGAQHASLGSGAVL